MAYKSYGSSRGFRPLKAGQEALNQQLIADEKVVRNIKTVRDQTEKRDNDLIQGLRRKFNQEDSNREANERLEDKKYQQRLSAIQKNAQRTRANAEIDIKNIEKEAEVWETFSSTAAKTLTAYAEHVRKTQEIANFNEAFQNPDLYKTESILGEAVLKKLLTNNATIASQAQAQGMDATTVTQLATATAPVKSVGKAKAIIAMNTHNYDDYLEDLIAKSGYTSYADIKKLSAKAPFLFAEELGVHKHGKLLADYLTTVAKYNDEKLTKVRISENYKLGQDNINEALQNWELYGKGGEDSQTWLDLVQDAVKLSYDEEGDPLGNSGVKAQLGKIVTNPRHIKNRVEFEEFLNLKTLANTDAEGNITNQSITIRQLYGEAGVAKLWDDWRDAKNEARVRDDNQEKVHQNDLFQVGKKAFQEEWKGDPKTKLKIIRKLKAKGASKTTLDKLEPYTLGSDKNIQLDAIRDNARLEIIDGTFYEDDFYQLPKVLQQEEEFKKGYQSNDSLLKEVGMNAADLKTNSIQFIIKDILGQEITTTNNYSATNNLAWQEYRRDLLAEYKFNLNIKKLPAQKAWQQANDTINDLVRKGEGKWRRSSAYEEIEGTDQVKRKDGFQKGGTFIYFDTQDKNYNKPYPILNIQAKITTEGKNWVLKNQVITRRELLTAIDDANDGYTFKASDELKAIAKAADIPLSELANAQIKLMKLPETNLFEPSLTEKAAIDVKPVGNYKLTTFAKDIKNIGDFVKIRAAVTNPRNVSTMSETTRWNLSAYDFGNNTPVEKFLTPERLGQFPAGQALLTKYFLPSGGTTNGARIINRRSVEGGTKISIKLPGNDPNEPHYLFLFEGGAQ